MPPEEKPLKRKKTLKNSDVSEAVEATGTVSILALKSMPCPDCDAEHIFIELANGGVRPLKGHALHGRQPDAGMTQATLETARTLICPCGAVFKVPAPA